MLIAANFDWLRLVSFENIHSAWNEVIYICDAGKIMEINFLFFLFGKLMIGKILKQILEYYLET